MRRLQSQWLVRGVAVAFAAFTALACSRQPAGEAEKAPLAGVAAGAEEGAEAQHPMGQPPRGTRIQGHVVRVMGPDRFVVRTADKREVILHTHPQTKFLLHDRPVRFTDLREGVPVTTVFDVQGERNLANTVTLTEEAVEEVPATPTVVEGTVVRVVEPEKRLVVRTPRNEEVIVNIEEQTTFTLDNRPVKLVDFRPGMPVRIDAVVRDKKHIARSVTGTPRRPE